MTSRPEPEPTQANLDLGACTVVECDCRDWEMRDHLEGGGREGEPQCAGPTTFTGTGFIYHRTCRCLAMRHESLCWGCYMETK